MTTSFSAETAAVMGEQPGRWRCITITVAVEMKLEVVEEVVATEKRIHHQRGRGCPFWRCRPGPLLWPLTCLAQSRAPS
jgi:hypothetical protein